MWAESEPNLGPRPQALHTTKQLASVAVGAKRPDKLPRTHPPLPTRAQTGEQRGVFITSLQKTVAFALSICLADPQVWQIHNSSQTKA